MAIVITQARKKEKRKAPAKKPTALEIVGMKKWSKKRVREDGDQQKAYHELASVVVP